MSSAASHRRSVASVLPRAISSAWAYPPGNSRALAPALAAAAQLKPALLLHLLLLLNQEERQLQPFLLLHLLQHIELEEDQLLLGS